MVGRRSRSTRSAARNRRLVNPEELPVNRSLENPVIPPEDPQPNQQNNNEEFVPPFVDDNPPQQNAENIANLIQPNQQMDPRRSILVSKLEILIDRVRAIRDSFKTLTREGILNSQPTFERLPNLQANFYVLFDDALEYNVMHQAGINLQEMRLNFDLYFSEAERAFLAARRQATNQTSTSAAQSTAAQNTVRLPKARTSEVLW